MPGASVVFHRLAAREYRAARGWYADRAAEAAENFRIAVDHEERGQAPRGSRSPEDSACIGLGASPRFSLPFTV
ncbi:MAG: hypothetical protein HQ581_20675 [Planctomycetes bacterium]|nr:hypothetical protein [Planctomycetota bacterium]